MNAVLEHLCVDNDWKPGLVDDCDACVVDALKPGGIVPGPTLAVVGDKGAEVIPFPKPEKRKRLGRTPWKRLRDRVCSTGVCVGCGRRGRPTPAFEGDPNALDAHHVYGRDLGGDDVLENLVALHHGCHLTYEDRATGWEPIAAGIRRRVVDSHVHVLYLVRKLGSSDAARSFIDRYYPERPTRGDSDAA